MRAIIVDDELQSHLVLEDLLSRNHSEVEVVATAQGVEEGLRSIQKHGPDLVFLDVEMPDGTGFDLLEKLGKPDFPVIFITAYNKYAITAFQFGAQDYLLKPINSSNLARALGRVQERWKEKQSKRQIQYMLEAFRKLRVDKELPTRVAIATAEGVFYRKVENIIRFEAAQSYTQIFIHGKSNAILASVNLGDYEEQFDPYRDFIRVHRSHLVNLNYVDKYIRSDGGYLVMRDGTKIPVSRRRRDELLSRLEEL